MGVFDPTNQLPGIEWQTRDRLYSLASRFQSATGLHLKVRPQGGRRTCAEQNAIYAQGRESPGEIVTYASGCTSWHVLGRAVDVDPVDAAGRGQPASVYATAGAIWKNLGGVWGGTFPGFSDIGHFEWHPGLTIAQACPSPQYCAAIEASIQTMAPFSRYLFFGAAAAALGYGGYRGWQWWRTR